MDENPDTPVSEMQRAVDRELRTVEGAIAYVASGAVPRVSLVGLLLAEEILPAARDLADRAGVRLVPLWHPDDTGLDLAIEALDA